ncbi:ABC transporter permease subunit [Bacillus haikouensis]|jgi:peptide/nickel transport system permease protein|uniref:ABC transporter permease subunit n=1 Tax=Bacillus haikouensis TaxID=1510468 RepID=UPI001555E9EB|nr:ABC transporter permease subunit [Bacillus haikouensis]NQD68040.1 ABC transporter permease subunit [Bacillus haikouensis]
MLKDLWKQPKFISGFIFITGLLVISFLYEPLLKGGIETISFLHINGETVGPPFTPAELPPLGSDRVGTPLWTYVVQGAKYTILLGLIICLLQILLAIVFSVTVTRYLIRFLNVFEEVVESMIYVPMAVIAFMLLFPLRFVVDAEAEPAKYILIQIVLLVIIGIPQIVVVLSKEIQKTLQEEFVLSAKTLGARGWFLYRRHILKTLFPRILLLFFQRNVSVLILFAHLGFLGVLLGGGIEKEILIGESRLFSLSNEWAGNIGNARVEIMTAPWIIFAPLVALSLTVLAYNMMADAIQNVLLGDAKIKKLMKKEELAHQNKEASVDEDQFAFKRDHTLNG